MHIDCGANTNISVTILTCLQTVLPTSRHEKCQITANFAASTHESLLKQHICFASCSGA